MRKLFIIAILSLFCAQASSQTFMGLNAGAVSKAVVASTYVGPGDVISGAKAFYSCRAYSAATVGTKAYRLIRASDSAQQDINSLASGLCDTTSPATFCNATTCKYVTWYDQSGANFCASAACDLTQATNGLRFDWNASTLNGWPCAKSVRANQDRMQSSGSLNSTLTSFTLITLGERTASFTLQGTALGSDGSGTAALFWPTSANLISLYNGTVLNDATGSSADSTFHAIIGAMQPTGSGNSQLVIDNNVTNGVSGTDGASGTMDIGDNNPGVNGLDGFFCEAGLWPAQFSGPQATSMNSNIHGATNGWNF